MSDEEPQAAPFDDLDFLTKITKLYDLWAECMLAARGPMLNPGKYPNLISAPAILWTFATPAAVQTSKHLREAVTMANELLKVVAEPVSGGMTNEARGVYYTEIAMKQVRSHWPEVAAEMPVFELQEVVDAANSLICHVSDLVQRGTKVVTLQDLLALDIDSSVRTMNVVDKNYSYSVTSSSSPPAEPDGSFPGRPVRFVLRPAKDDSAPPGSALPDYQRPGSTVEYPD